MIEMSLLTSNRESEDEQDDSLLEIKNPEKVKPSEDTLTVVGESLGQNQTHPKLKKKHIESEGKRKKRKRSDVERTQRKSSLKIGIEKKRKLNQNSTEKQDTIEKKEIETEKTDQNTNEIKSTTNTKQSQKEKISEKETEHTQIELQEAYDKLILLADIFELNDFSMWHESDNE
jgi:hypothetical protein